MAKKTGTQENVPAPQVVQLLVDAASADTVYADLYVRRARELLGSVLTRADYNALKGSSATSTRRSSREGRDDAAGLEAGGGARGAGGWTAAQCRRAVRRSSALGARGLRRLRRVHRSVFARTRFLPGFDRTLPSAVPPSSRILKQLAAADTPSRHSMRRAAYFLPAWGWRRGAGGRTGLCTEQRRDSTARCPGGATRRQGQLRLYAQELAARRTGGDGDSV